MKAVFFDPYLDTIGGGERYLLTLAEYLLQKKWEVDLIWRNPSLKEKLEERLNRKLEGINFINPPQTLINKWQGYHNYDLSFWVSDGSVPFMFSRKNILHFQVPFHLGLGKSYLNQIKFKQIQHVVCNSQFTKKYTDQEYGVYSEVIYPPIDLDVFKQGKKENIILSVGRFSQLLQSKRQDVLIEVFKEMVDEGLSGWRLIFAGGAEIGGVEYLERLKKQTQRYPIEILENLSSDKVVELYSKAKIFWNASGFEIDEDKNPERVEHFGMVIVEAMASGCIPIVVGKGGIREIIGDKETGFFWEKKNELGDITKKLIKSPQIIKKVSDEVVESSRRFSREIFCQKYEELLK